jgi:hypothetical protein
MELHQIGKCLDTGIIQKAYTRFFSDDYYASMRTFSRSLEADEISKIMAAFFDGLPGYYPSASLSVQLCTSMSDVDTMGKPLVRVVIGKNIKGLTCDQPTLYEWFSRGYVNQLILDEYKRTPTMVSYPKMFRDTFEELSNFKLSGRDPNDVQEALKACLEGEHMTEKEKEIAKNFLKSFEEASHDVKDSSDGS